MTDIYKAAQQALEALKKSHPYSNSDRDLDKHSEAIHALRTALAEPDHFVDASNMVAEPCEMGAMCLNCQPRGPNGECPDAPQPKAEQPAEQEPVAWMCSNRELMNKGYELFSATGGGDWNIPVYTAPQPRRNVTYVCPVCAASLERQE